MNIRKHKVTTIVFLAATTLSLAGIIIYYSRINNAAVFDGKRALKDVYYQVGLGPRIPGSIAHEEVAKWLLTELDTAGWGVVIQNTPYMGKNIKNIIGKRGIGEPWIILGAHYDTRLIADKDPVPENRNSPVPGANDGASGVSILLELARTLPENTSHTLWLVFFDAEDNGNILGWDWIMGSQAFVEELTTYPDAVVILDMVGDRDLNIYYELNSDNTLSAEIWEIAASLGYEEHFIASPKHSILDDHTPFLQRGIPAIDIIDFDYDYHHTISDTPDKVSAQSLQIVGETITTWLLQK